MPIAIFDIDGVVADVRHRLHHLDSRPKDWDGFFRDTADDPPLAEGLRLVADLASRAEIVWLTGRPAWLRPITLGWLAEHGLPTDELHMRPINDRRPARMFKLGVLNRLRDREIVAFVDDDNEVVDAALAAGLPAVLAEWVPREDSLREAQDRLGRS